MFSILKDTFAILKCTGGLYAFIISRENSYPDFSFHIKSEFLHDILYNYIPFASMAKRNLVQKSSEVNYNQSRRLI